MQVLLDDIPCDVEAATVDQALRAAAAVAEGRGRLIVDVVVDGRPWTQAELASDEHRAGGAEVVRLASAEPRALVRETLAEAREALAEADGLQREAAELLQSDRHVVSMDRLHDAVGIWLVVGEAIVKSARAVGLDLDSVRVDDVPLHEAVSALNGRLAELRDALAAGDEIALADALLYEFPQIVEQWRAILAELDRRVGDGT